MHQIDQSFKSQKQKNTQRRSKILMRRIAMAATGLVVFGFVVALVLTWDMWSFSSRQADGDGDRLLDLAQQPLLEFVPTIVDLAGDPLIISVGQVGDGVLKVRPIATPPDLADQRLPARLQILADTMLSSSERFMTTLPSRQQDFAFFQAQSGRRQDISEDDDDADDGELDEEIEAGPIDNTGGGWGETLTGDNQDLPEFKKAKIENNTSVVTTIREADRFRQNQDFFARVLSTRTLDSFLIEHKVSATDAKNAGEAMKEIFNMDTIGPGNVVAIRTLRPSALSTTLDLVQVSIYSQDTYLGTLALNDQNQFRKGADPWVPDDLFDYSQERDDNAPKRQYRLLDAIYSTAARNNLPSSLIGETIQLLSRSHDLDVFVEPDDKLMIIFSRKPRDPSRNAGRILYIGLQGQNKNIECFSFRGKRKSQYSCMSASNQVQSRSLRDGMVTPVNGVLTSGFGPRKHPILKTVRIHKGVDWAAPIGTPVYAAFSGKISYAGDGGDYGIIIKIIHGRGRATRYAHLNRIATGARPGRRVKAGDIIGYVGNSGRSTGPHLHFEVYRNNKAVDPLATSVTFSGGGKSADVLVDRIIRIESGGRADAKNPLSSASGLGQFISSTWLTMINRYRPDLAKSLSRAEILNLRFDPTISREMLYKFTYENEAYLRARGHAITPGRLYLAHFLGSEGANTILVSANDATVVSVMGSSVVNANPFLSGWNVEKITRWAERKMSGKGGRAGKSRRVAIKLSPEFIRYRAAIENLVRSANAVL